VTEAQRVSPSLAFNLRAVIIQEYNGGGRGGFVSAAAGFVLFLVRRVRASRRFLYFDFLKQ
jgi:hypothetical protein